MVKMGERTLVVPHQDTVPLHDRRIRERQNIFDVTPMTKWFVLLYELHLLGQCVMWDQR